MINGKQWALGFACLTLLLCGVAHGQAGPAEYNRLCLHNGGEHFLYFCSGNPHPGAGKYHPRYAHIPSTPTAWIYEWKIKSWSWTGMNGTAGASAWNRTGLTQRIASDDDNYSTVPSISLSCTFPAPHSWASGALMTAGGSGWSHPVFQYSGPLPSGIPYVDGEQFFCPSSCSIYRPPYQVSWPQGITPRQNRGCPRALELCLFLEDSILAPVNVMTDSAVAGGSFCGFGFKAGTDCITPLVTGGNACLGFATEDYKAAGQAYAILASRHTPGAEYIGALPSDINTHQYPCRSIDGVTHFFLARLSQWLHTVAHPFPACAHGNLTVGGHSAQLPIGTKFQAGLPGKKYVFCGFPTHAVINDCSAGWMVCWR